MEVMQARQRQTHVQHDHIVWREQVAVHNVQNQHQVHDEHIKEVHDNVDVIQHEMDIIQRQREQHQEQYVQHDIDVHEER